MKDVIYAHTTVKTTKSVSLQISEDTLFNLLNIDKHAVINLKAFVQTGGMYDNCSNMNVDLKDCKLIVQYDTVDDDVISTILPLNR